MKWLLAVWIGCSMLKGQTDVRGSLKLVDRPPDATPVEALAFRLHPFGGGLDIEAQPDRNGNFILSKIRPGRYALTFPMPGRIESLAYGGNELAPEGFELSSDSVGPLVLVISMKTADVVVKVQALPSENSGVVALLAPADTHLTLRESCYLIQLSGPQVSFGFVPAGKYRMFVFDGQFQQDVSIYAPRSPDFLKNEATALEVPGSGQIEVTATYLNSEVIQDALRQEALRR